MADDEEFDTLFKEELSALSGNVEQEFAALYLLEIGDAALEVDVDAAFDQMYEDLMADPDLESNSSMGSDNDIERSEEQRAKKENASTDEEESEETASES